MSRVDPKMGLCLFDLGLTSRKLAPIGVGTFDSVYTEADPVPGHPELEDGSAFRPHLVAAQSVDLTLRTLRGGYPGRDGATTLYRLATDTAAGDWRGWQDPVLVTGWSAPSDGWGSSSNFTDLAVGVVKPTQVLIITACDDTPGAAKTWKWDPRTGEYTLLIDWASTIFGALQVPIAMAYDEARDRIILQSGAEGGAPFHSNAFFSDDHGVTWDRYAQGNGSGDGFVVGERVDMVPQGDSDWMALGCSAAGAGGFATQYASSDLGISWDVVQDSTDLVDHDGQACLGPAGFVYAAIETGTNDLICLQAPAARSPLTKIATIAAGTFDSAFIACDDDGTLYAIARGSGANLDVLTAYYSVDGGFTWVDYEVQALNMANNTAVFVPWFAVCALGRVHLVGTSTGAAATNATVQVLSFGGWAHVTNGVGSEDQHRRRTRFGWGGSSRGSHESLLYVPVADTPDQHGWALFANTGAVNLSAQPALRLTTTAGQAQQYHVVAGAFHGYGAAECDVMLDASGNVTLATLGTSGGGVGFLVSLSRSGGGGHFWGVAVDIGTDGIQFRDGSTIKASVPLNMTTQFTRIRVNIRSGDCTVWYSRDYGLTWVRIGGASETLTNLGAGVGNDEVIWGNGSTRVGKSYWRFAGVAYDEDWLNGIDQVADGNLGPSESTRGHQFGGPIPARGWAYPIPDASAVGEDVGFLTASQGPTHSDEQTELPTGYEHPVEAIDPLTSPSPRRTWQTVDDSAVALVWDHGADQETWHGAAMALLVMGATPRLWVLEEDDGAGGWTTLGTLDLAIGTSLAWVRVGRFVACNTGGTPIARYIRENELVGGTVDLDGDCRRILSNSAGYWTPAAVQRVRIELDGIDGTEAASGTAGVLCAPNGMLVGYFPVGILHARRYVRVTVAGSQPTPDGTYQAGIVAVGRVVAFGRVPDWTWSSAQRLSALRSMASDGVSTVRQLGPPRRVFSYSWPDGCFLLPIRSAAITPDHVATSGGGGIATVDDVPLALPGFVDVLKSGQVPCVLLRLMPTTTGVVLDPDAFVFGRMSGEVGLSGRVGNETVDELVTVTGFTIEELR